MHRLFPQRTFWLRDLAFLTITIGLLYGIMLGSFSLAIPDSARYAEIPREMVSSGDYLTPHINGIKYFEKPPLFYWLQALAIKSFGLSEWAIHFPNASIGLISCLFLYIAGRKLYGREAGIFSSLVLATSSLPFVLAHIITLDLTLTTFLSAALLCFILSVKTKAPGERNFYLYAMYIFAAFATMTKGLIGIVFPALIIFCWIAIFHKWRDLKAYRLFIGSVIFFLIVAPWHILVQLKNPEFSHFYFFEQHFLRYFTAYAGREQSFWFFPAVLVLGFFPWIFFLPQAIAYHLAKRNIALEWRENNIYLMIWALIIFLFYLFSNSKLAPYILPMFPPLALLVGNYLAVFYKRHKTFGISVALNSFCIGATFLGIGIIAFILFFNTEKQHVVSDGVFYITAATLLFAASITYSAKKFLPKYKFASLIIATMFFLLSLPPVIDVCNNRTIKPLIALLQTRLQKGDEVASYRNYYPDLPYYLRRRITVVDFQGELEFGIKHADTCGWMLNLETFWQLWNGKKRIFLFANKKDFDIIKMHSVSNKLQVLGAYLDTILLKNM